MDEIISLTNLNTYSIKFMLYPVVMKSHIRQCVACVYVYVQWL